jgi:DNA-3-methyladenine glycosylase
MARRKYPKVPRSFYARPTLEVARDILGKYIVYNGTHGRLSAKVVEVEAYIGEDDPACHAFGGPTRRSQPLFGPPGYAYIYLIYGMYHCFNFVTEPQGRAAAVLLRAAEPDEGVEMMRQLSPGRNDTQLLSGPGRFCRSFGLDLTQNCIDLTSDILYLEDRAALIGEVAVSTRIGISKGTNRPWRFYDKDSQCVSAKV